MSLKDFTYRKVSEYFKEALKDFSLFATTAEIRQLRREFENLLDGFRQLSPSERKELEKHYFNTNIISQSIQETCLLSKLEILTNLNQSRDNLSIIHTELIKTEGVFQRINQEITQKYYKERSILNEINYQMRHFLELSSWFFSHYEYK